MLEIGKKTKQNQKELQSKDTDTDGLNDSFEKENYLNRQKKDTNSNKILDDKEDTDKDKLTNLEEQKYNISAISDDTDLDQLSDYDEIKKYHTNPNKSDSDKDNITDGIEVNKFHTNPLVKEPESKFTNSANLPKNKWNIIGKASGIGDLSGRYMIRNSPILLINQMKTISSFDLYASTDISFEIDIPVNSTESDLKLYRYVYQNQTKKKQVVSLQLIPDQTFDPKTKTIHAEFNGGDTFVVLSEKEMTNASPKKIESHSSKLSKEGKVKGLPNIIINPSQISKDGILSFKKEVTVNTKYTSLKNTEPKNTNSKKTKPKTTKPKTTKENLIAQYKVQNVETENGIEYASVVPLNQETGLNSLILLHGYRALGVAGGTSESVGFTNNWTQSDEDYTEAETDIPSSQTLSGATYQSGDKLKYDNPDVQFITGNISSEKNYLGPALADVSTIGLEDYPDYTPNHDLFIFEYDNDDENIHKNSIYLNSYIQNLRNIGKIPTDAHVNIAAHSMGGLVARYLVENLDLQTDNDIDVGLLMTIGTPYFGVSALSDWFGGDMDRSTSCLWNGGNTETGCEELTGTHSIETSYIAYAGQNDVVDSGNLTSLIYAPSYWDIPGSYNEYFQNTLNTTSDLDDNFVTIDTALGSDEDFGNVDAIDVDYRYLVSGYLGSHSAMLTYDSLQWNIYLDSYYN
ncbi:esterase/lipase family protein [Shimazuella kribbensis]|uniref:esterase/lipase family protein n=1 Tax=Shimazuella kribbensis TaxID=139808 RepID=UPI0003FF4D52|nr:hypothetical protein [Shimazuella kribbensis]